MRPVIIALLAAPLFVTLLGGCQTPSSAVSNVKPVVQAYHTTPTDIDAIIKAVKSELRDPDSAQFGNVTTGSDSGGVIWACGTVNARNAYGGYTGHVAYAGMLADVSGARVFAVTGVGRSPSDTSDEAVRLVCRKQGLAV